MPVQDLVVFRVLIMGDSKAGKSTLLKKWCEIDGKSVVKNARGELIMLPGGTRERGEHNIYDEVSFETLPGFVFHDSCGFEAGTDIQMNQFRRFVEEKSQAKKMKDQLHIIWHCIAAGGPRLFTEEDTKRVKIYHGGAGSVPVTTVFTKVDLESLHAQDSAELWRTSQQALLLGKLKPDSRHRLDDCQKRLTSARYPPSGFIRLENLHLDATPCPRHLTEMTMQALNNEEVLKIFVALQKNNVDLKVKEAVHHILQEEQTRFVVKKRIPHEDLKALAASVREWFSISQSIEWDSLLHFYPYMLINEYAEKDPDNLLPTGAIPPRGTMLESRTGLILSSYSDFLNIFGGLVIVYEYLCQTYSYSMPEIRDTEKEDFEMEDIAPLERATTEAFKLFQANYRSAWSKAVKWHRWVFKEPTEIEEELIELIMKHRMPVPRDANGMPVNTSPHQRGA